MLDQLVDDTKKELKKVKKKEQKLNSQNITKVDQIKEITCRTQELTSKLRKLAEGNESMVEEIFTVEHKIQVANAAIEEQASDTRF